MPSISLKAAIYFALLVIVLGSYLIWYFARQKPLFDKNFRAVWNVSPFGIVLLSSLQKLVFINQQAETLLGVQEDEWLTSTTARSLVGQVERRAAAQHFSVSPTPQETVDVWCGRFGNNRLLILRDLSVQRKQEQEAQVLWSNISHELRTPMTSMLSHLELVRSINTSDEVRADSLGIVQQQAERLTHLVQNSLELGRLKSTEMTDKSLVDMVLVVEEAIAEMILLAEKQDNRLTLVCDEAALNVYGNRDKLKQVLVNLLDNALKYCLAGDSISVSLGEQGDAIVCTVEDTGNGIAEQHLERITEQFYRADRQQPGSGLGLAIVQEIVRQHNGTLVIESETNGDAKGTRVSITLPKEPN